MSDTYIDIKTAEHEAKFGGFHVYRLEEYTPTRHLDPVTGLEILKRMAQETHSTSQAADLRYLHCLIMQLDSSPLPF